MAQALRNRALASLLALALGLPGVVGAQPRPAGGGDPPSEREEALALFHQSAEHYRAGQFDRAAELLRQAYDLYPEPVLLLNLARALEASQDLEGAATAYRRYLEASPRADDRLVIERRIALLERAIAEHEAREELEARLAEERAEAAVQGGGETAQAGKGARPAPWVLVGAGAAIVVGGAVTGGLARARNEDARLEPVHADAVELAQQADRLAASANALFAVGGATLVGGLIWGLYDVLRGRDEDESEARVRVDVGLGSIVVRGVLPGS